MLLRLFYPYECTSSAYCISYEKLYRLGYRGIIFDIDNTLVPHGADATPEVEALFRQLHELGFQTLLLSNNGEERINRFLKNIDSAFIANAGKPKSAAYLKAVAMLRLEKQQIVFIGDQIFTDIFGANRSGIASILVTYIRKPGEVKIGMRRHAERLLLRLYGKSRAYCHRLGDILSEGVIEPHVADEKAVL